MTEDPTQQGGQETPQNPRAAAMQQIAARVHEQLAPEFADFDEESGQITPREEQDAGAPETPEQSPQVEAAEEPPPAPKMLTIIVDGQPIEVEESRILEAGKRTLQKDHAADKRLQEAAQLRRYYETQIAQLQRPSTQDAPAQAQPASAPQAIAIDPATLDTYLENKMYARDAQKAAEKFIEDFPEIAGDPHLMALAARLEQQRIETAAALGEGLGNPFHAYRKHGEAVMEWLQKRTGSVPVQTDKQDRKRTIQAIPAVNARAPAPKEERPMTNAEKIEQMRQQRLQGRPVPQRTH